jgi:Protein of unknown function (DUF3575)
MSIAKKIKVHRIFFSTLVLLLTCFLLPAQEKLLVKKALSVSLTGSVLNTPEIVAGIQPGIQYQLGKRWAFLGEIGIRLKKAEDSSYNKSRYFKLSAEAKYFLGKRRKYLNKYVSFMTMYAKRNWKDLNTGVYQKRNDSLSYQYSSASVKSPLFVACAKYGMEFRLGNKMMFEFFAGLGARVIATRYDAVNIQSYPRTYPIDKIIPSPDPADWYNQTLVRPHFTAGIRLQYYLWKE